MQSHPQLIKRTSRKAATVNCFFGPKITIDQEKDNDNEFLKSSKHIELTSKFAKTTSVFPLKPMTQEKKSQSTTEEKQACSNSVSLNKKLSYEMLVFNHIYQSLGDPISEYVEDAKQSLKNMGTIRSRRIVNGVQKKLLKFISSKTSVRRVFNSRNQNNSDNNRTIGGIQSKYGQEKAPRQQCNIFDRQKLEEGIRNYYSRDKKKVTNEFQGCLVEKLIKTCGLTPFIKTQRKTSNGITRASSATGYRGYHSSMRTSNKMF